jgi:(p)ppGpp synthase/HD superfamily hydrolase
VRKGTTTPYIAHLLATAALVLEEGGSEEQAIAAVLHDAVEDAGGQRTLREIRRRFGPRVARIVEGCTDAYTIPKPPWRQRKQQHVRKLEKAPRSVLIVSAADKLHNARSILTDCGQHGENVSSTRQHECAGVGPRGQRTERCSPIIRSA